MTSRKDGRSRGPEIDDATVEDLLAGRPVTAELEPVAAAVRVLRAATERPAPPPSAELARQMATGTFTGDPAPAYRTPARQSRRRRLLPKAVAVAVAGAVLGVGTTGFAGSLPEPAQDRFETVVESVSPYEFPKKAGGGEDADRDADPVDRPDAPEPSTSDDNQDPAGNEENKGNEDKGNKDKDKDNKDKGNNNKDKDKDKDKGKGKDKDKGKGND